MPPKRKRVAPMLKQHLIYNLTMTDIRTALNLSGNVSVPIEAPSMLTDQECLYYLKKSSH